MNSHSLRFLGHKTFDAKQKGPKKTGMTGFYLTHYLLFKPALLMELLRDRSKRPGV